MANDTKIPLFRRFVIQNFPFIEQDFDALTDYQLISKIVEYLNQVITSQNNLVDDMNDLETAFNTLKDYVDHYFDNLDVTEEINNKLDSMAEDGTLTNLIKAYVDPIYQDYETEINYDINQFKDSVNNEISSFETNINGTVTSQNSRIDNISNIANSVASGSPAGVYATVTALTTADPDHSKIYVVTADGKWYYYDSGTSAWVAGGTYQSELVGENDVHFENLDSALQENLEPIYMATDIDDYTDGYYLRDGSIASYSSANIETKRYEFSVLPFEVYKIHMYEGQTVWNNNSVMVQYVDENDDVISNLLYPDANIVDNIMEEIVKIPVNCAKLRINFCYRPQTSKYKQQVYITKLASYDVTNIHKSQLDTKLQSIYDESYETVTPSVFINGYYVQGTNLNGIRSYNDAVILEVDVEPYEEYIITGKQYYDNSFLMFASENYINPFTVGEDVYNVCNIISNVKDDEYKHDFENYKFTIPSYCTKLYINGYQNDTTLVLKKCTGYKVKASSVVNNINKNGFSKIWAIGDSITKNNYYATINYLGYINADMPEITVENLGENASGYKQTHNTTFIQRISQITDYNLANDIVTVMGSVNDVMYAWNLGHLGDTTTDTLYGSMYQFFTTLFTEYPACRVGAISPLPWKFSDGEQDKLDLYVQALKETCELFNVPFLDIHNASNLRPNNNTFLTECYTSDGAGHEPTLDSNGIHPNSKGHRLFYERIKNFINTL